MEKFKIGDLVFPRNAAEEIEICRQSKKCGMPAPTFPWRIRAANSAMLYFEDTSLSFFKHRFSPTTLINKSLEDYL